MFKTEALKEQVNQFYYNAFLLLLSWAHKLSWIVPVNAGFLRTKAAMLNAVIKARPCRKNHYQYPLFHPQCKGKLFLRAVTATFILNCRTRWRRTVSFKLWPLHSWRKNPQYLGEKGGPFNWSGYYGAEKTPLP